MAKNNHRGPQNYIDSEEDSGDDLDPALQEANDTIASLQQTITAQRHDAQRVAKKHKAELNFLKLDPAAVVNGADVTIVVRDSPQLLYAHRLVLSSRSPVFKKMFANDMVEKLERVVKIEGVSPAVMDAVLKFCYTAEIKFTDEIPAQEVFKVAHKYRIDHLQEACSDKLINTLNEDNLTEILRLCRMYKDTRLQEAASQYLKKNFDTLFPTVLADL